MQLPEQLEILVEDIGFERVLEDNDLTQEDALEILFYAGAIDIDPYFKEINDEE